VLGGVAQQQTRCRRIPRADRQLLSTSVAEHGRWVLMSQSLDGDAMACVSGGWAFA
jgi:hypothetical protein